MGLIFWLVVFAVALFCIARFRVSLLAFTVAAAAVLLVARLSGWLPGIFGLAVILLAVAANRCRNRLVGGGIIPWRARLEQTC